MYLKSLVPAYIVSSLLLTLLTPLIANGQTNDVETQAVTGVAQKSCAGIGNPLSKADLMNRVDPRRINTPNALEFLFELFAIKSVGFTEPNKKGYFSLGINRQVVPDAVGPVNLLVLDENGTVVRRGRFQESVFFDAKARVKNIGLDRNNPQALGYIDVLANDSPAGKDEAPLLLRPVPRLIYLTVSDTKVTSILTERAKLSGVAVYQSVVCDNPDGQPRVNDLIMGRAVPLNPTVYIGRPTPNPNDVIKPKPGAL